MTGGFTAYDFTPFESDFKAERWGEDKIKLSCKSCGNWMVNAPGKVMTWGIDHECQLLRRVLEAVL